ncbi:hypothetical protein FoTM2_007875 [Fusarium oxysporum f. sp. vasinfectum]|nr:hypothetical protein FoTM2_007875 [Fusarium oxysporum f. sp. vasinfectum]
MSQPISFDHGASPNVGPNLPSLSEGGNKDIDNVKRMSTESHACSKEISDSVQVTLEKRFSFWSLLGYQLSVMASWSNYLVIAGTFVYIGGPVAMIYGALLVGFFQFMTAMSLSELASAWPHAGGSQFWITQLMSPTSSGLFSYLTGWMNILAYLTAGASANFAGAQTVTALVTILNGYEWPLITIAVWASDFQHQSAQYVFTKFINSSGWKDSGMAFLISLTQTTYAATGLDAVVHLSEETYDPKRTIPLVLTTSVAISTLMSFGFAIFLVFKMGDFSDLVDLSLGQVYLELYTDSIGFGAGLAVATTIMTLLAIFVASQILTGSSRLVWAMARQQGVPFSNYFSHINQDFKVPIRSFVASFVVTILLGLLYLAGDLAWNAIASSVTIAYQLVFTTPIVVLLCRGRARLPTRYFDCDFHLSNYSTSNWGYYELCSYCVWHMGDHGGHLLVYSWASEIHVDGGSLTLAYTGWSFVQDSS